MNWYKIADKSFAVWMAEEIKDSTNNFTRKLPFGRGMHSVTEPRHIIREMEELIKKYNVPLEDTSMTDVDSLRKFLSNLQMPDGPDIEGFKKKLESLPMPSEVKNQLWQEAKQEEERKWLFFADALANEKEQEDYEERLNQYPKIQSKIWWPGAWQTRRITITMPDYIKAMPEIQKLLRKVDERTEQAWVKYYERYLEGLNKSDEDRLKSMPDQQGSGRIGEHLMVVPEISKLRHEAALAFFRLKPEKITEVTLTWDMHPKQNLGGLDTDVIAAIKEGWITHLNNSSGKRLKELLRLFETEEEPTKYHRFVPAEIKNDPQVIAAFQQAKSQVPEEVVEPEQPKQPDTRNMKEKVDDLMKEMEENKRSANNLSWYKHALSLIR